MTNVRSSTYECNRNVIVFASCCVHVFALLIAMSLTSFLKNKKFLHYLILYLINMGDLVKRHVQEFTTKNQLKSLFQNYHRTIIVISVHSILCTLTLSTLFWSTSYPIYFIEYQCSFDSKVTPRLVKCQYFHWLSKIVYNTLKFWCTFTNLHA